MTNDLRVPILEQLYRVWRGKGGSEGLEREQLAKAVGAGVAEVMAAVDLLRLDGLVEPLTMRRLRITAAGIDGHEAVIGAQEDDLQARRIILGHLGDEFHAKGSKGILYLKAGELGLEPIAFERNCWYLEHAGLIEGIGIGSVYRITAAGVNRLQTPASAL